MFTFFRLMSFCLRRKRKMKKKRRKIRLRMNLSYSFRLRNRNLRSCCGCLKSRKSRCSCFPMNMMNRCCCCAEQSTAPVMMKTLTGYTMSRFPRMSSGCKHCRCSGWLLSRCCVLCCMTALN